MSVCEVTYRCDYPECEERIAVRSDSEFNDWGWERRSFVNDVARHHVCRSHSWVQTPRLQELLELTV